MGHRATGLGRQLRPSLHLLRLMDPTAYAAKLQNALTWQQERDIDPSLPQDAYLPEIGRGTSTTIRLAGEVNTIWCSAAGPHTDCARFAVGTSRGTWLVGMGDNAVTKLDREANWPDDEMSLNTLAVDFQTHTNILCGMRSGKVRLWDCRVNDSSIKFQHASCVTHLRAIGEEKVVVAGLEDQVRPMQHQASAVYGLLIQHPSCPSTTFASSSPSPLLVPRKSANAEPQFSLPFPHPCPWLPSPSTACKRPPTPAWASTSTETSSRAGPRRKQCSCSTSTPGRSCKWLLET